MSALCPSCRWPVRVTDGAIVSHPRFDTGEPCTGAGSIPEVMPATVAGRSLVARLRTEEQAAAARADEDEQHTYARLSAKAERDQLRRLLRWIPEELRRAEREAADAVEHESARLDAVLEAVG